MALAYRFYEKEVAFYRDLAHETPLRTPEVYFAAHDLDTDNFVLAATVNGASSIGSS